MLKDHEPLRSITVHSEAQVLEPWEPSRPEDMLHRFSFSKFINQFVQITYFPHQWIFNFFQANTTNDAFDLRTIWMQGWSLSKEGLEVVVLFDLLL